MIFFPNVKINIGLRVTGRRADGYHDLETVMLPVYGLCDALEIVKDNVGGVTFSQSGIECDCPPEKNLCVKAYGTMRESYGIGGARIHLHKNIPTGAGLGGGSADAAFVIRGLNEVFGLGLPDTELERMAAMNGSDTAFFIKNVPALATGRGEILSVFEAPESFGPCGSPVLPERSGPPETRTLYDTGDMDQRLSSLVSGTRLPLPAGLDLKGKRLVIVKPDVSVSTAEAYAGVTPRTHTVPLIELLNQPVGCWRDSVFNDFEKSVFARLPILAVIKDTLYNMGALYASMSGSGSAVYGIFEDSGPLGMPFEDVFIYQEVIG